jgi:predicted  nucleic acid-binding Zn-ribbon protein
MKNIVETLFAAQTALKRHPLPSPERRAILEDLRAHVSAPVLAHFLRLVERGRPGVTLVRHGVCGGCHLRVASGVSAALANPKDLHLCDNCGTYLLLAPEELAAVHELRRSRHIAPATVAA